MLDQAGEDGTRARALLAREIPATLQDLVMARLDRMEGDREVAQLAAVLGREFSYELLAAVADRGRADAPGRAGASWCRRRSCTRRAGRPDAPTSSSTPSSKTRCTTRWSRASGSSSTGGSPRCWKRGSRRPSRRSRSCWRHHFTEAGLTEKAVGYWLKAGLRSRERSADCEAIGHLTKGLALLETLEESRERDDREVEDPRPRWAPPTSRSAVTPRPKSGRSCSARRELCRADRGCSPSCSRSCWAAGSGTSCAAICGRASDLAAEGMALAERLERPRHADGSVVHAGCRRCSIVPNSRTPATASRRRWPPVRRP